MRDFIAPDLAALFAASDHISLFVWEHSPGWPVLHCTDNVESLLGYNKKDFYQRNVRFIDTLHPEDLERVSQEANDAIEQPACKSFTHQDYRMIRADGAEIWISDTTVIERDKKGKVRYLMGYLLDITDRKHLELALLAERTHLSMVLEGARLGSWDWNPVNNSLLCNTRWLAMYGYENNSSYQSMQFWRSLLHPEDLEGWERALKAHIEGHTPFYEHVYRMRHREGHWLHILDRGKIVEWDGRHRAVRFSGTHTDISEQKKAEIQARRTARSRTVFVANMSHEIRTPLHGILGLASVLEGTELNQYQRDLLKTMQESGDYLLNTLNDAIDISRAEEGKLTIAAQPTQVADIVRHLRALYAAQANRQGLEYEVKAAPQMPLWLSLDKSRFLQIATNLINNAFKFTQLGFIQVNLNWISQPENQLQLEVRDSGSGIADTKRVWQVFEQEENTARGISEGSGLGLSIVQSLVELMDGSIDLESSPGRGSCFRVSIPAIVCEPPPVSSALAGEQDILRILVIDDSDVNQLLVGEMLSILEHVYVCASSAEVGLELLQQQTFDVVFMDIHLPDMSGIEATRKIREKALQQPYVIGLTANAVATIRKQSLNAGMNAYLTKPFTLEHIKNLLSEVPPLTLSKSDWQ
ncbi:hybrid sensor histidine kinase/response regulator [Aliidiomarina minuta]|uniref:histidine kinase n=1 Tax=Aliidiomarina minuta TaxID=880057 RepID=A0A432W6S9_9GAMM|nr:PAS domain-containing hybrid sensor histidine kinase/response regulator [Aliidiomarina minuta]RUO25742.1 hybrid sensor histidine kinase/response regulator [Aliidiomarina minuta]